MKRRTRKLSHLFFKVHSKAIHFYKVANYLDFSHLFLVLGEYLDKISKLYLASQWFVNGLVGFGKNPQFCLQKTKKTIYILF